MNTFQRLLLIGPVVLLAACATIATNTTTKRDYDRNADFTRYKTYAWVAAKTQATSPAVDQAIRAAVDKGLAAHGFKKADGTTPGFYVTYHVTGERPDAHHYTDWSLNVATAAGAGYYQGWPNNPETYRILDQAHPGTLILDMIESGRNALVWRGVITSALDEKAKDDANKATVAANLLIGMFPPPPAPVAKTQ
ncbi:hypothetical protein CfE428DRAFT_0338 [Chthoniobacter flavus Ellin428]|uniref:DUF4136 domain-containing protein n=1 Tax=Chthoniobacter flavus Ellin428 TaxID=497964 RepID=B4CUH5_9BACT|nr:DUF4136 domain-containing protein [Chthoniobacter flavus]EDY22213.1 hypothetical protein CfE428DRAFT_0338 [Chthoniobacter flavus Ellin428]TCO94759.1 uncharacterized protein DUF4136 [Chthoniobacter flavus]